jgi:phospholipid/cholesterol/gamma-HCH transport system substrate-binding protein
VSVRRQIKRYWRWVLVILAIMAAGIGTALYIAVQQRLPLPFREHYTINAEFATSSGVTAGVGQPVNVSGVRVGIISGSHLKNGRAVVSLEIEGRKLAHVYADAHATLVPNTPLKDMLVEVYPGRPPARELPSGGTIPVARTSPPIDSDELTAALDRDVRDFLATLLAGVDEGTRGRGQDLRALLRALGPTIGQVRELNHAVLARRRELRRFVGNLASLGRATEHSDQSLGRLVVGADRTLGALASQQVALRQSVARLPATLRAARRTLDRSVAFSHALTPTLTALTPSARRLPSTLRSARPVVELGEPLLRRRLRPLVRELQPFARNLSAATGQLDRVTPHLSNAFRVLTYVVNELAYNPPGPADEGLLFWLAWFVHNIDSGFSAEDSHGAVARGFEVVNCTLLALQPESRPLLELFTGVLPGCQKATG